jgi:hypothetical protein
MQLHSKGVKTALDLRFIDAYHFKEASRRSTSGARHSGRIYQLRAAAVTRRLGMVGVILPQCAP